MPPRWFESSQAINFVVTINGKNTISAVRQKIILLGR